MQYLVILNPAAGHGSAGRQQQAVAAAFAAAGLEATLAVTQAPGHAMDLARAATAGAVIAVGGDGTVQEVVRGLVQGGQGLPLGVLPMGTGNDFVKMLGMPRNLGAAVDALAGAEAVPADYGRVRWQAEAGLQERVFINAVGIGLDAQTATVVDRYKWLPGLAGYLVAALQTLFRWTCPSVYMAEGTPATPGPVLYEGPFYLATAGNGASSGGGFLLTPDATIQDGLLDVCLVQAMPRWRILGLLPLVPFGKHTGVKQVQMHRLRRLFFRSEVPLPVHADGELISTGTRTVAVEVVPAGLHVLQPRPRTEEP